MIDTDTDPSLSSQISNGNETTALQASQQQSTTFLNNSTIPTYEEFSKKPIPAPKKPVLPSIIDESSLVTDDESDDDELTLINKKKNFKVVGSPYMAAKIPKRLPTPKFLKQSPAITSSYNRQRTPLTSKNLNVQLTPQASPSHRINLNETCEYVMINNKEIQTSFNQSENSFTIDDSKTVINEVYFFKRFF